jgi:transposase
MLKRCEQDLLAGSWEEVQPGVEVKEVHIETGSGERFLLCRSRARIEKDRAIVEKAASRLEAGLRKLQAQIASGRETYIGLTEAEAAFRELKSPLGLRPVYHQKENRVEAHIFIAFLALCLRRSLALWMEKSELGTAPQKLLKQLRQIHSLDVILTAKQNTEIRRRVVSTPGLPNRPKIIENVVATLDS